MVTLFHHPFCPHSRFVRLALGEYGITPELIEERAWDRREGFLAMNPAGSTPVLLEAESATAIPDATIIAEYLDETRGLALADGRLLPHSPGDRIEVRRLMTWFHGKFFTEVTDHLTTERVYRRLMTVDQGGGPPDTAVLRVARTNIRYHLAYMTWLLSSRTWLGGERLSYADFAAAAHLSVADYLGDVPWTENEGVKNWYARVKSRPSFRALLSDTIPGIPAAATYADLDF